MTEARADADEVGRDILEEDRPAIRGGLADQALAEAEFVLQLVGLSAP